MNKKLLAVAIAGAFIAPAAMADTSNVVISGTMHFSLDSLKGNSSAAGTDNRTDMNVSSNASNIIFKGSEDLGNGLSGIFQIQSFFSAGNTGNNDTSDGGVGDGVGSGATFVGLSSKTMGTLTLGKHESPFKLISRKVDLFNNSIGDSRNLTASGGATGTGNAWDLRPNNSVSYTSPSFNGLGFAALYQTNNNDVANSFTNEYDDRMWAMNVNYENGPILAMLGYEKHDTRTATATEDAAAWRAAAGYNFGPGKVVAFYQRSKDNSTATGDSDNRTVWGLGGTFKVGAKATLKAQYYKANKYGDTADSGANMFAVGADYALSKRTTTYVAYARTNNQNAAAFSAFGGGHGDNPGTVTGKDPSGFSLGVIHNF